MKLLIIDDSELLIKSITKLTEPLFGKDNVYYACSVGSACNQLLDNSIDVVVIDIQLPDGSGFDILEFIKNNNIHIRLKIVLTNFPNNKFRIKSRDLGADYFLDKSSEFNKIIEVCKHLKFTAGQNISN